MLYLTTYFSYFTHLEIIEIVVYDIFINGEFLNRSVLSVDLIFYANLEENIKLLYIN